MSDLTGFLLARIAEDKAAAMACGVLRWRYQLWDGQDRLIDTDGGEVLFTHDYLDMDLIHIARWHASRVIAECDAKRRIIELHAPMVGNCGSCAEDSEYTLRLLALPYADHEDYQEKWRP